MEQVEYDKDVAILRGKLAETEFSKVWEEGQNLTMDEAITFAVQED